MEVVYVAEVEKIVENIKISADMTELLAAGVMKHFSEKFLIPYVGNGNYLSGVVKLVGGVVADRFLDGKISKILKTALIIDGVEDVVNATVVKFNIDEQNNNAMVI